MDDFNTNPLLEAIAEILIAGLWFVVSVLAIIGAVALVALMAGGF